MNHLARVARMSEAISGILLNAACHFAHAGYSLMRVVGVIALLCAAMPLLAPGAARQAVWPISQAQAREVATVKLLFGSTAITLERNLIDYQSSPRRLGDIAWSDAPEYEVSTREGISLLLDETIPGELPCRKYLKLTLHRTRPVDIPPIPRVYRDWEKTRMENKGIVRFITPSGGDEKIDYYEFENDDLRNYLGEPQLVVDAKNVFHDTASMILMTIHIHPEIDMKLSLSSRECFLREGPALTRHIRNFLLQRIRSNS